MLLDPGSNRFWGIVSAAAGWVPVIILKLSPINSGIKSVCLKETDDTYMFLVYMTIAILVGYSAGSYMNKDRA